MGFRLRLVIRKGISFGRGPGGSFHSHNNRYSPIWHHYGARLFFFIARGWGFILRREGVFGGLSCGVFEKKSSLGVTLPPYSTYFKGSYSDYQTI